MQSKYKIRMLRANLCAAALLLALWSYTAPLPAFVTLWLTVIWLLVSAFQLDFSHRRAQKQPWQVIAGGLLLLLIVSAPERHNLLIWLWAGIFMLPQSLWALLFNASAALLSWIVIYPLLSLPEWLFLFSILATLTILAHAQALQFADINRTVRQRLRLVPSVNLWAGEQFLRDLTREQMRSEREAIYAQVIIIRVKRRQLWQEAQKLCGLVYAFENVYRLDSRTLAVLLLSPTESEGTLRRERLYTTLPENSAYQHQPLMDLELSTLSLDMLCKLPSQRLGETS